MAGVDSSPPSSVRKKRVRVWLAWSLVALAAILFLAKLGLDKIQEASDRVY
jgi:hypothetical protein